MSRKGKRGNNRKPDIPNKDRENKIVSIVRAHDNHPKTIEDMLKRLDKELIEILIIFRNMGE